MASSHHPHHHNHHHQVPQHHLFPATTTAGNCCCYCTTSTATLCSPPPPPLDPLVHSISSHHYHFLSPPPPPPPPQSQPHLCSPCHNPPPCAAQSELYPPPQTHNRKQRSREYLRRRHDDDGDNDVVLSLHRRIAALEFALRRHGSSSLRDVAARTIQVHFRAFLVRRSRTLRQLKDLAFIRSSLNTLKSSISEKTTHFDIQVVSRKAMDLLVTLDSIQGGDPMIRDGKRSISRELIRFMDFVESISPKRVVISGRARFGKNVGKSVVVQKQRTVDSRVLGGDERKLLEKLRHHQSQTIRNRRNPRVVEEEEDEEEDEEVECPGGISTSENKVHSQIKIRGLVKKNSGQDGVQASGEVQPKVKKNVTFSENGNVYRVIRSNNDAPGSCGDSDSMDGETERELIKDLCRKVEEIESGVSFKETEEDQTDEEDDESPRLSLSDGGKNDRGNLRSGVGHEEVRNQEDDDEEDDDDFVFSAPLPVKMESRADFSNKKPPVKK